ncbi:MAG: hypothetical protein ACYDHU_00765 [Acidimicrobiales bacterium]
MASTRGLMATGSGDDAVATVPPSKLPDDVVDPDGVAPDVHDRPGSQEPADPVPGGTGGAATRTAWTRRHPAATAYLVSGTCYVVLSVVMWWHVWSSHPSSTSICGCGDPALFLWFIEWPAYAIAHGHSVFFSTYLFHPTGINLLANTSVLAIGVPLAPVTWIFGPVASLNVALTLSPVLGALAMYWLLRRWVRWAPAAFFGGLLFGFSPFVLENLAYAHLMTGALAVFPLVVGCLDELLVRQQRRSVATGVVLGLLVALEFFVSTEMLVILVICVAIGVVVLVGGRWVTDRGDLALRARRALPGVAAAGIVGLVLLGYPAWYALAGPAHLSGPVWPGIAVFGGSELPALVHAQSVVPSGFTDIGGYFGSLFPSTSFLGWGMIAVLVAGLAVWRRDRRLWFFGVLAIVTTLLSVAVAKYPWSPWRLFYRIPVLYDVIQQHFTAVTYLAVAAMLAVIVDRTHAGGPWARRRSEVAGHEGARARRWSFRTPAGALAPAAPAALVALVALGPIVAVLAPVLPYTVRTVDVPAWYAAGAAALRPGQVLLSYPAPFSGIQSAMAWQAVGGMHFSQVGGSGPESTPRRAGREKPGFIVLSDLGLGDRQGPVSAPSAVSAVRTALGDWKVTMVVIANLRGQPLVVSGGDSSYAAGFMTAVLGRRPTYRDGAWVWAGPLLSRPSLDIGPSLLATCTASTRDAGTGPEAVPDCVLGAAAAGSPVAALNGGRSRPGRAR